MATQKTIRETLNSAYTAYNFEDSLVLSDGDTKLIILSPEGKRVWTGIQEGKSEKGIASEMAEEYGASLPEVETFVSSTIESLVSQTFIKQEKEAEPSNEKVSPPPESPFVSRLYGIYGKKILIRYGDKDTEKVLDPLLEHCRAEESPDSGSVDITCDLFKDEDNNFVFLINGAEKVREASLVYVKNVAVFEPTPAGTEATSEGVP